MSLATRRGMAVALAVGIALLGAWRWVPGGQDFLPLDAAYVQEAQQLGRAVGQVTFKDFDPSRMAFLIIKKGGHNYLINYAGEEKLPGDRLVVDGLSVLHLREPIVPVDVGTVLPVMPGFLRRAAGVDLSAIPAREMAAVAMGRTSLSGHFASELQAHDLAGGQQGLLQALAGPRIADESVPSDLYVTVLVHEAFHVYQWDALRLWMRRIGQLRHAEEAATLLERAYQDPRVQELQRREGEYLGRALGAADRRTAAELAREFLGVRAARRQHMEQILGAGGAAAIELERLQEWSEGLARYVEIRSWQVGAAPGYRAIPALQGDPAFHGYREGQSRTGFRWGAGALLAEIGRGATGSEAWYTLGSGQALVLDRLSTTWHGEAMRPTPLEGLLAKWVGPASAGAASDE